MKKAVIIIARNEGDWPAKTADNFRKAMPDAEIIGVDDGGTNKWPDYVKVVKTTGGIGVGNCRRAGAENTDADLVVFTDGHVHYVEGDIDKAWQLAQDGYIVNPSCMSMATQIIHGCGRKQNLPNHKATYVKVPEGSVVGLIGSVYFMKRETALEIVAPTPSHGYNEQIMTYAAIALGYKTYALPGLVFSHLFKKKFDNYRVTYSGQQRNRMLCDLWFFSGKRPQNLSDIEKQYYKFIQANRKLSVKGLESSILQINRNLKQHDTASKTT